jgi:hypothetical protein
MRAVEVMVEQARTEVARVALDRTAAAHEAPRSARAIVEAVLALPELQVPQAKNPYGDARDPFHAGARPDGPGCVALEAVEASPGSPAKVVVRGEVRRYSGPFLITREVLLD